MPETLLTEEDSHQAATSIQSLVGDPRAKEKVLVEACRQRIKVAMTGDGVNDILALKTADCSIAMESGNDATKRWRKWFQSRFRLWEDAVHRGRRSAGGQ